MQRQVLLFILINISVGTLRAQQSLSVPSNTTVSVSNTGVGKLYYADRDAPPRAIEFKDRTVTTAQFLTNINQYFNIPAEFTFVEAESNTDNIGMHHRLLQQYYNGIPLEGMGYRVHEKDGFITSANGKSVRDINLDTQVNISEEQAFQLAVNYLQTKDTTVRNGKKLIVSKDFTYTPESFSIAFQFDIDVSFIERWRISIDSRSGQMINKISLVNNCFNEPTPPLPYETGTGITNYYGSQTIRVEKAGNGSRLVGQTEHGGIIGTYNFGNVSIWAWTLGFYTVYDFYSDDNTYNDGSQRTAVSVQWAAEQAYEYYFQTHNRNSFDNNGSTITSYVHVDEGLNNAFWSRNTLLFGDGSNNNPLVELDVVSHELTHGVTQYEAALQYYDEPGALNESFSDILGKAIEFDTFGDTATWQLAKHFQDGGLRDFSNPNLKDQPDTYFGDLWYSGDEDNGGVHYNSGVQNYWYYLLCEGGSGVNDHGESYSITSIGMDAATNIAYRNLTEYLSSTSDYLDSRIGSLLATADLYGINSTQYQEVDKAWDAVGVIDEPIITSFELYDITATTIKIRGNLEPRGDVVTYHFEYGTTPAYGTSSSIYPYTDKVEGTLTGLQSQTKYYIRLVATNENGSTFLASQFTTISLAPLVKIVHTADVTETTAILYGEINSNSLTTSFYFEYGPTPALGLVTPTYPLSNTTEFLKVSASVVNLQPRQTYYYRLKATNGFASAVTESLNFFTAVKPVITSFSPVTAPIGTEITITGQNFNPAKEKNLVSFGAVRATVLSLSATQIKIEVPPGASFGTLSLLDIESGLNAESVQEFVPTFTGEFKKGSMQLRVGIYDPGIYQALVQDMDGDGRPDIVTLHDGGFSVFQNVNQGGDITEESFIRNTTSTENSLVNLALVDFDGNGLKDVVATYQNTLRVYPNFSVPGFIFFGVPVDLTTTESLQGIVFDDFDLDGRIDIAGTVQISGDVSLLIIFRNQNPGGVLAANNFVQQYSQTLSYYCPQWYANDLNNDGKPELLATTYDNGLVHLLNNESHPGTFDFEENLIGDPTMVRRPEYGAHDLNKDGWKDITSHTIYDPEQLIIFENQGTSPGILLVPPIVLPNENPISVIQPGDLNGDGGVDLVVGTQKREFIILENKGSADEHLSTSSFEKSGQYGMVLINTGSGTVNTKMTINDLNGDGRPEVINAYTYNYGPHDGYQMEIWQNSPNNCLDPSLIEVISSNNSATIVLPPNTTLDQFEIEYAPLNASYWWQVSSTTLGYVYAGQSYQVRARAKCYLGFTEYYYLTFTTDCVNPDNFSISSVGVNEATVYAYDLGSYEIQYALAGNDQWKVLPQYANQILNLLPGTSYDLRFRGRCSTPSEFKYRQFTTLCPNLSELSVSEIIYNRAVVNWTSNYSGTAVLEYSADNTTWTSIDATRTMFPLIPGQQYSVRGKLACTDIDSDFIYKSFTTPCPKVTLLMVDMITPFSARINWVDESQTNSYTIRYSTIGGAVTTVQTTSNSFNLDGLSPGTQYTVAVAPQCIAVKDFTSTTFSTVCYVPYNLSVYDVTHTTAELSWSDNFSGVPYAIEYSILGSNVWLTASTPSTNLSLVKLRPGTTYEARVHINCISETASYVSLRFETDLYEQTTFFPNPTDYEITIHPSQNLIGNRFSIYDNTGKQAAAGELLDYTIDLSGFASGIYFLKIDGEKPMKIIKY